VRGLLLDVRPLRESPTFRAWWTGSAVSLFGGQLTSFAVLYAVWTLTHSPAQVGGVAVAELGPTVVGALAGGSLADRLDRRRLLLVTRSGQLVCSLALALLVVVGTASVLALYAAVAVQSLFAAAGAPANRSFPARLLPPGRLSAGLALDRVAGQASLLAGPVVAGLVTAAWGVQVCFLVDAGTFVLAMYGVARLPATRPAPAGDPSGRHGGPGLLSGLRFVLSGPVLLGAFATDAAATVLAMPWALFPVVNDQVYGGSPVTLGLFGPAVGLGGIVAGALSGPVTASPAQGRLMLASAAVWGAALAGFGLSRELGVALACLAVAGAADTVTVVARTSIVQAATPDALRGRVSALDHLVGVCGPQVGNLRAGLVASATSGAASAALGGLACVVAVATVAVLTPSLRRARPGPVPPA
jgi:MFS family permease